MHDVVDIQELQKQCNYLKHVPCFNFYLEYSYKSKSSHKLFCQSLTIEV